MNILWLLIQFFPLSVFLAYARLNSFTNNAWPIAFQLGALLAVLESTALVVAKKRFNRLILGANVFLIIGGLGFLFKLNFILSSYSELRESTLLLSVFIIGLITTFFTRAGFIELPLLERPLLLRVSSYLMTITLACFAFSLYFRGNPLLAGVVPFLCIILARWLLRKRYKNQSSNDVLFKAF